MPIFSLISASKQASAAKSAARSQEALGREAIASNERAQAQVRSDLQPYRDDGVTYGTVLKNALGLNGQGGTDETNALFHNGPGFQFGVKTAQDAANNYNQSRGGIYSGGALVEAQDRAQGMQNQEFGSWLDRITGGVDRGQNAAVQTGSLTLPLTQQNANTLTGIGDARAAGTIGAANAWSDAASASAKFFGNLAGGGYNKFFGLGG